METTGPYFHKNVNFFQNFIANLVLLYVGSKKKYTFFKHKVFEVNKREKKNSSLIKKFKQKYIH